MQHLTQKILITGLIILLSACGTSPKSEADSYNDMRDGTIFKAYQKVSIEAMKPVIKEYNKKLAEENKAQTGEAHVHATLALIWIAALQPKYALAETDYAINKAIDPRDRYALLALQSVAMHEEGWPNLAKQNAAQAKALIQANGLSNSYSNILVLVHVAGSALALSEGNIPYVASEVRELGNITNQSWLTELGGATEDVYAGAHDKAIAKLEKIKSDPNLSEQERMGVDKVLQVVKTGGKDVVGNMGDAVVALAFKVGIQNSSLTPQIQQALPEKYRDKLTDLLQKI
jgi:hypothetical protein